MLRTKLRYILLMINVSTQRDNNKNNLLMLS